MVCSECGSKIEIDYSPEFNEALPFERVCYSCGWFDAQRYATKEAAEAVRG